MEILFSLEILEVFFGLVEGDKGTPCSTSISPWTCTCVSTLPGGILELVHPLAGLWDRHLPAS
jgi:hypothetical protein